MLDPGLDHLAAARAELDRCRTLVRSVDHHTPVAHLGGWPVGEVIAHLAGDFVWAIGIIGARAWDGEPLGSVPERGDALIERFDDLAESMYESLGAAHADPEARCPNFAQRSRGTLGWWVRHQTHEITLHRWDIESASGRHAPIDPAIAADGIDEMLHMYTRRYGRQRLTEALTIGCRGVDAAWRFTPRGAKGRVDVERCPGLDDPDVEGDPEPLLLAMWHRLDPDQAGLRFHRAEAVARAFLAGPLTA